MALTLNSSTKRLAIRGLMEEPMVAPWPVHNTYLGRGSVCFKAIFQEWDYLWYGHVGPSGEKWILAIVLVLLCWWRGPSDLKWRLPWHHKMPQTLHGSSLTSLIWCTKCWVFLRWCGDWPTKGCMMLANSLATQYVMDPLLDTMGLAGDRLVYFR